MTQFSNVCGASPVNNRILLFDRHKSQFDDGALRQMMCKNIQPFVIKSSDSINDQTNNNGLNAKLKSLYKVINSTWMLKYGMKNISPPHINSFLVEAWDIFKTSYGNIIRESLEKKKLLHIIPPKLTTNTQACAASIQISYGAKAE